MDAACNRMSNSNLFSSYVDDAINAFAKLNLTTNNITKLVDAACKRVPDKKTMNEITQRLSKCSNACNFLQELKKRSGIENSVANLNLNNHQEAEAGIVPSSNLNALIIAETTMTHDMEVNLKGYDVVDPDDDLLNLEDKKNINTAQIEGAEKNGFTLLEDPKRVSDLTELNA